VGGSMEKDLRSHTGRRRRNESPQSQEATRRWTYGGFPNLGRRGCAIAGYPEWVSWRGAARLPLPNIQMAADGGAGLAFEALSP